ncbi:MAG: hypothetical protein ACI4J7_07390 [Ruminiclostridium sp.]
MNFSELKFAAEDTGLSFDESRNALIGSMHDFGVIVSDSSDSYEVLFFADCPYKKENEMRDIINSLSESLPKNTIISQSCQLKFVAVSLDKRQLLQENLCYLVEFLDKLSRELEALCLTGTKPVFPTEKKTEKQEQELPKNAVKISLRFDMRSLFGLFGAILGAFAITVIAILLSNVTAEAQLFGLRVEISAYILSAAATALIFSDYRFLAKKLDPCGIIVCPVLSVLSVIFSGLGSGIKAVCALSGAGAAEVISDFSGYLSRYDIADKFIVGYISRGIILAVLVSLIICLVYFRKHPEEMIKGEKIVTENEKKQR